jgi:hypothetical protein
MPVELFFLHQQTVTLRRHDTLHRHAVSKCGGTKTHTKPPAEECGTHHRRTVSKPGGTKTNHPALSSTISSFTAVHEELLRLTAGGFTH